LYKELVEQAKTPGALSEMKPDPTNPTTHWGHHSTNPLLFRAQFQITLHGKGILPS
jgi:hypothetical protein